MTVIKSSMCTLLSPVRRSLTSTIPSDVRLPTTIRSGKPIKSASLNLTPARSYDHRTTHQI